MVYPGGPDLITQPLKVETLSYGIREMRRKEERSQLCVRETRHAVAGFGDGGPGLRAKGSSRF